MLCSLIESNAIAQDVHWHPVYENYTTRDGFLSMETYHSCQDENGYIWFATDRGVVRYNGREFKTFTVNDGLISDVVFKVVPDDKGRIWFLSNNPELCYYENGEIKKYKYNYKIKEHYGDIIIRCYVSWSISNDEVAYSTLQKGSLRINSSGKLAPLVIDSHNETEFFLVEKNGVIYNSPFNRLAMPNVTRIWMNGDFKFSKGEFKCEISLQNIIFRTGKNELNEIYVSDDKGIIIYTSKGIVERRFKEFIYSVFFRGDEVWIGFDHNGVRKFRIVEGQLVEELHLFQGKSVSDIFRCKDGYYWFATLQNGVFKVPNLTTSTLIGPEAVIQPISGLETLNSGFLFGNLEGHLFELNGQGYLTKLNPQGRVFSDVPLIKDDIQKKIFINYQYAGAGAPVYDLNGEYLYESARCIKFDCHKIGKYYYTAAPRGVHKTDSTAYLKLYGKSSEIQCLEFKDSTHLWVSTRDRLETLNLKTGEYRLPKDPLLNQRMNDILAEGDRIYFASNGNGLIIKEGKRLWQLSSKDGMPRDYIQKIRSGGDGTIWLQGINGVTQLKLLKDGSVTFINFPASFLMCDKINSISIGDEFAYIATNKGIVRIKKDNLLKKPITPKLTITSLKINNVIQKVLIPTLQYNQNNVVISYDAVSFENQPISFRYRYAKNEDWTVVDERSLRLNSLASGEYQFEIQASIPGSNWSESEVMNFEILPPFWKRWWFILIEIIVGLGLIVFLVILRLRFVDRRYVEAQKNMQLRQEALSQQMNPHFIFNALGSVQNSILKGDSLKANSYLVRFSRLLRSGLNASRSQFISLEEDQELMQNYLAVEKSRLGDDFTFIVEVELTSEPYSLHIPPFLLQPFLENSIKHGFGDSQIAGHIDVRYTEEKESIKCVITDNGVGREVAKKKTISNHTSHGVDIAFERVDLFNRSQGFIGKRVITDGKDADGNAQGTIVMFSLPKLKK